MAIRAHIAHQMPGRTRIRVPEKQGDHAYFQELERAISSCPGVEWASASSITGGMLVYHKGEFKDAIAAVIGGGLIEIEPPKEMQEEEEAQDRSLHAICHHVSCLNGRVGKAGGGGVRTMVFYGLVGTAVYQVFRGQVLPPTGTLLAYAAELLLQTFESKSRPRAGG